MNFYSPLSVDLWNVYADEFKRRWDIDREVSAMFGARGKKVFAAEFKERGAATYRDSVLLPIRNAFYSASVMKTRWQHLSGMNLSEPILDYGCGVGFTLMWLKRQGFNDLYAHELDGVQGEVMRAVTGPAGIKEWHGERMGTVLCINVLEHVNDPVSLLDKLLGIGNRVIANICTDDDAPHIASHAELEKCRAILESKETLYRAA